MSELEKTIANFRFVVKMLEEIHKDFCWYRDHGENVFESNEKFLGFTKKCKRMLHLLWRSQKVRDEFCPLISQA